jgi:ABC-type multidrug transport system ATPase subunit
MASEGLTTLVSTHYMDEAERCNRILYLAEGRIVAQGPPDEVVREAKLSTFQAVVPDADEAAHRLRQMSGVEAAAVFGRTVHIAGTDRTALEHTMAAFGNGAVTWQEVPPRLEDAFIHLLGRVGNG